MNTAVRNLVSVVCGMTFMAAGFAQEQPDSTPFDFSVTLKAEVTDNRDSAASGQKEDNTDFYVTPKLGLSLENVRTRAVLSYAPSLRYRTDPSVIQNDYEFYHEADLSIRHEATPRMTLQVKETFNYTDDPAVDEGGVTLRRDSSYMLNRVSAGVNYAPDRMTSVDVIGRHMVKRYDEAFRRIESDADMFGGTAAARRQVSATVALGGFATYQVHDSKNLNNFDRGFDTLIGGVSAEKLFGENLKGDAQLGWQMVDYGSDELDSQDSPYMRIGVEVAPNPGARFKVHGAYSIKEAYAYPYASQKRTQVHSRFEWDASPRLTVALSGEYRLEEYDADKAAAAAAAAGGDETTVIGKAELAYEVADRTYLTLAHMVEDVDSDVYVTFTRNVTSLVLTRNF